MNIYNLESYVQKDWVLSGSRNLLDESIIHMI